MDRQTVLQDLGTTTWYVKSDLFTLKPSYNPHTLEIRDNSTNQNYCLILISPFELL